MTVLFVQPIVKPSHNYVKVLGLLGVFLKREVFYITPVFLLICLFSG